MVLQNSYQAADSSVALGQNSVATEANTVSVGRVGSERRITNVTAGINATDAVNVSQLQSVDSHLSHGIAVNAEGIAINAEGVAVNRQNITTNTKKYLY